MGGTESFQGEHSRVRLSLSGNEVGSRTSHVGDLPDVVVLVVDVVLVLLSVPVNADDRTDVTSFQVSGLAT